MTSVSLLASCAATNALRDLVEPKVELKNVEVKEAGFQDARLLFNLEVQNPNAREIAVDQLNYIIKLNGKKFTEGTANENLKVGANSSAVIGLPVKVKYSDLASSLADLMKNRLINYELEGDVKLGLFSIPFEKLGVVELDKP